MNKRTGVTIIAIIILAIIAACWIILDPINRIQYDKEYIPDGRNCFANGVLCKNINCDLPGGCLATECLGGIELRGALTIKCINISRSK